MWKIAGDVMPTIPAAMGGHNSAWIEGVKTLCPQDGCNRLDVAIESVGESVTHIPGPKDPG